MTSRQIRDRLMKELNHNVALRVKDTGDETTFEVSGRGELHLTILVENMRREGYELAVSRPRVVLHEVDGVKQEPYEMLTVDVEDGHQGGVMEELGRRKGEMLDMASDSRGRTRLEYRIPARGLIGFQGEFMTLTRGTGLMSHVFDAYGPIKGKQLTNVRASGTDEAVRLVPPIQMSLEYAVEFIDDDELVEVTPQSIRLRKRHLKEHERRRASREGAAE